MEFNIDTGMQQVVQQNDKNQMHLYSQSITVNGRIFIIGGRDINFSEYYSDVFEHNKKTKSFIQVSKVPIKEGLCYFGLSKAFKQFLYVLGGRNQIILKNALKYNIENNIWNTLPELHEKRSAPACCIFNNEYLYVFGGYNGEEQLSNVERMHLKKENE